MVRVSYRLVLLVLCLSIALAAGAATKTTKKKAAPRIALPPHARLVQQVVDPGCTGEGQELEPPFEVTADGSTHVLNTKLEVWPQKRSVPVLNPKTGACTDTTFDLRMYKVPGTDRYAYPGPTLRVRRAEAGADGKVTVPGDRIRVLLENHLTPNTSEDCIWAQGPKELCDCSNPDPTKRPQCCNLTTKPNGMNCFHGGNDTNLHFHGTHVSPQAPQDYVLLQLQPFGTTSDEHNMPMGNASTVKQGSYQYDVNPLPWNQAEGTHWYHPHKHGSTAEQVGEGLAGMLVIEGPFDRWLQDYYGGKLREKVMVIQTIHDLNFNSTKAAGTPMPLINGQITPKITMNPGEIQRWRMLSATMEASAQLEIDFNGLVSENTIKARQIAMDGVQFSRLNYKCQPLFDSRNPRPCNGTVPDEKIQLSPGNRADFLVQAPADKAGQDFFIPFEVFGALDRQGETPLNKAGRKLPQVVREQTRAALDKLAPGGTQPALFSVHICKPGVDPGCVDMSSMHFPTATEFPDLPGFLHDIKPNRPQQNVQYQILNVPSTPAPNGTFAVQMRMSPSSPLQSWQFNEDCANFTEPLDPNGGEEWHLSQNLNKAAAPGKTPPPLHVFHIHTNPFQVVGTEERQSDGSYKVTNPYPTPIWQDSITLPNNKNMGDADHASTRVVIRQRFEDYTGPYVLHCHFLGHEDRGMMVAVQTVCPNKQDSWSVTSLDQHECTFNQYIPALKPCTAHLTSTGGPGTAKKPGTHAHGH